MTPNTPAPACRSGCPRARPSCEELEKLAKETEFLAGYVRVKTPHIAKEKMYLTSGHLPYYAESMFPPMTCWRSMTWPSVRSREKFGSSAQRAS